MPQLGIPFVLTGPDGTRAVFNSPTDPDFVGYLDSENGITGLLDSADVRESYVDHAEGDGGSPGDSFLSRRVGTLQGFIIPDPDMFTYNARESKLKRASRGLRAASPSILTWTPDGSVERFMRLYRQGKVATSGRRPKTFVVPMSCPDPYVYSTSVASLVMTPAGATGTDFGFAQPVAEPLATQFFQAINGDAGFSNPMTNAILTRFNRLGAQYAVNQGDAETWPTFEIKGPITNPTLVNNTTGQRWTLTITLGASDTLVVNSLLRTVILNGVTNRYSAYAANFATNHWWPLVSGTNSLEFSSSQFTAGAQITLYWRHAFE